MSGRSRMTIERRVAQVSGVTALSAVTSILLQLVSVPVCLRAWGQGTYGRWLTVFAAYTVLRTVDGGYINYVGNKLNVLYNTDQAAMRRTLASATWGVVVLGVAQLALLGGLFATGRANQVFGAGLDAAGLEEATLAVVVLSLSWMASGSYMGIVHRFLIPAGLMYQAGWWTLGFQWIQFGSLMTAALLRLSVLQSAFLMAAAQASVYLASGWWVRHRLASYFPWWRGSRPAVGLLDLARSFPLTLSGALLQAGAGGVVVAISGALGPLAVPAYSTVRTMANLWTTAVGILTGPLLPDVVRYQATGEPRKLIEVQRAHWVLVGSLVNLSVLAAHPLLRWIHATWTSQGLMFEGGLLDLLLAAVVLAAMSALTNALWTGVNDVPCAMILAALRGGLVLLACVMLLGRWGLEVVGWAAAGAELILLSVSVARLGEARPGAGGVPEVVSHMAWPLAGAAAVVAFLLASAVGASVAWVLYLLAAALCPTAAAMGWRTLDGDVKARIRSLIALRMGAGGAAG